ncbi:MAG: hypothetical protein HUJ76_11340, partial [Parasporobacterium sp.]|nr:hypothetical protein [Parasporobacterium sp.]
FDKENDPVEQLPLPTVVAENASGIQGFTPVFSMDHKMVGWASNRGYSLYGRSFISITNLEIEYAKEGTQLLVLHGNEGKRRTMIRATVKNAPYKPDRRK